jgi:hypothetical protein
MADRVTVFWKGTEYDAVRSSGPQSAPSGEVWQVMRDGAPVTTFTAQPGEPATSVKEKILGWLEGNASRPAQDVGRQ